MATMKGLVAATKAANAAFRKMTKAQKRVAVAKDVIKAISLKQIKPTNGAYLQAGTVKSPDSLMGYSSRIAHMARQDPDGSFQELLPKLPACQVCAKGAIFVCAVRRQNEVTNSAVYQGIDWEGAELSKTLKGLFSPRQLAMIENEFEESNMDDGGTGSYHYPCIDFEGEDAAGRMRLIMRNIIRNKGTFKPKQEKQIKTDDY